MIESRSCGWGFASGLVAAAVILLFGLDHGPLIWMVLVVLICTGFAGVVSVLTADRR